MKKLHNRLSNEDFVTIPQVAKILGIHHVVTVHRYIKTLQIQRYLLNGKIFFKKADVAELLNHKKK